jgi:hypothetical protein
LRFVEKSHSYNGAGLVRLRDSQGFARLFVAHLQCAPSEAFSSLRRLLG